VNGSYWDQIRNRRLTRRRALAYGGAAAFSAAFLSACGGDDDGTTPTGATGPIASTGGSGATGATASTGATAATGAPSSGLLTQPVDETASPRTGGTLIVATSTRFTTWDPMAIPAIPFKRDYNELFYLKPGKLEPGSGVIGGDLAGSWEFSPDGLTLTATLTDKAHFSPVAPTNGRGVDADDVLFSWERLKAQGLRRAELVNELNPSAPILNVTSPDARTVQMQFSEPLAGILYFFATQSSMNWPIVPKEAADESVLDLRSQVAGTGLWNRGEVQEDVAFVWQRNPGFGQDERGALPYIDEERWAVIPEYAAQLAQFKTGNVHMMDVNPEDIIVTKQDVPELEMMATKLLTTPRYVIVGQNAASPFTDERVRQAYSMSWDRDLFIATVYNVAAFEAEGLPMETRWSSVLQAESWEGWWLDPQGSDFGENAKFYEYNVEEATALLSAAGHAGGLDFDSAVPADVPYGPTYARDIEIVTGMAAEAGFRANITQPQFATEFRQIYSQGSGDFSGLSYVNLFSAGIDPASWLFRYLNSAGSMFYGFDADGSASHQGDPTLDELTNKLRLETDADAAKALAHDIQRQAARKMYFIAFPGGANSFALSWPAVRNLMVYVDDTARPIGVGGTGNGAVWLDQTKAPFA
jgi:peptide/nickel transport system substrate-binding protein